MVCGWLDQHRLLEVDYQSSFFLFTKKNTRGDNRPLALAARGAQPSDKIRSRKDGPPSPKSAEGAGPVSSTGLTAQSGPPGRFDGSRTQ